MQRSEPKHVVAVAISYVYKTVRQTISNRVVLDATSLRIETIETSASAGINSTPLIFSDASDLIGGETFLDGVEDETWMVRGWIIDAS